MARLDLTPTVLRLLEAIERCNTPDFERALAQLRELTGYTDKPGRLRCAWCDGIWECLPEFRRVAGVKSGEVE